MQNKAKRSKNWLLIQFRKWHTWTGLVAALFLIAVSLTGVVLNYKKPILGALGLEKHEDDLDNKTKQMGEPLMKAGFHLDDLPVSFTQVLEQVREQWGDVPLEKLELKDEKGWLVYRIKPYREDKELWVDAHTGDVFAKKEYEKIVKASDTGLGPVKRFDWGKFFLDLHTGKIAGEIGKALMTGAAVILFFLTCSGIYLYAKPLIIRLGNRKKVPATKMSRAAVESPSMSAEVMTTKDKAVPTV